MLFVLYIVCVLSEFLSDTTEALIKLYANRDGLAFDCFLLNCHGIVL